MKTFLAIFVLSSAALAATPPTAPSDNLYRVTVLSHSTSAFNYAAQSAPTRIGFRGTVLAPAAKGQASILNRLGAVQVDARFSHLGSPQRFGLDYLTYVLWAISPDGKSQNLGELVLNGSDKGRIRASSSLQSFALIVTAEPYFSVTHPSGVVVCENYALPGTTAQPETLRANYDLLPAQPFTYDVQAAQARLAQRGPKVSNSQYQAIESLYQALNAIQLAASDGADQRAPGAMKKARDLYERARSAQASGMSPASIVATAREAAQTAEDARLISGAKQPPAPPAAR